jgi:hypothetical protein
MRGETCCYTFLRESFFQVRLGTRLIYARKRIAEGFSSPSGRDVIFLQSSPDNLNARNLGKKSDHVLASFDRAFPIASHQIENAKVHEHNRGVYDDNPFHDSLLVDWQNCQNINLYKISNLCLKP